MKNRCILTSSKDDLRTRFICLGENDSVVASKTTYEIILFSMHSNDSFTLRVFSTAESEIKDKLYERLCTFLKYGKITTLNRQGQAYEDDTFDVEKQIDEIKKCLNK